MIFVNLLPDIKLDRLRARRLKRIIVSISMLVIALCLGTLTFLILDTQVSQKRAIDDWENKINAEKEKIEANRGDIEKYVTLQKKLEILPQLYDERLNPEHLLSDNGLGYLHDGSKENNHFGGYLTDLLGLNKNKNAEDYEVRKEEVSFDFVTGAYSIGVSVIGDDLDGNRKVTIAQELRYRIGLVGNEPCTKANSSTRQQFFTVPNEEPASTVIEPIEGKYGPYQYKVHGTFLAEAGLFDGVQRKSGANEWIIPEVQIIGSPGICSPKLNNNPTTVEEE